MTRVAIRSIVGGLLGGALMLVAPPDVHATSVFDSERAVGVDALLANQLDGIGADPAHQTDDGRVAGRGGNRRVKAMLLSLLVPGLGEFYAGNRGWAYLFFGTEAAIWSGFAWQRIQGNLREDRYEEFAEVWAGVDKATGWDESYYTNLGRYPTYEDYRVVAIRSQEGDLYPVEAHWEWQTDERRLRYGDIRADSNRSFQRAEFIAASALLNRALSVVHVARSVKNTPASSLNLTFRPNDSGGITPFVAWRTTF